MKYDKQIYFLLDSFLSGSQKLILLVLFFFITLCQYLMALDALVCKVI